MPSVTVSLPIAERRTAHDFYVAAFGLEPVGEIASDGLPEPLQFVLGGEARLMLIPRDGLRLGRRRRTRWPSAARASACSRWTPAPTRRSTRLVERARAAGADVLAGTGPAAVGRLRRHRRRSRRPPVDDHLGPAHVGSRAPHRPKERRMSADWPLVKAGAEGAAGQGPAAAAAPPRRRPDARRRLRRRARHAALTAFQKANGLDADGVAGTATWTKVVVLVKPGQQGEPVTAVQELVQDARRRRLRARHGEGGPRLPGARAPQRRRHRRPAHVAAAHRRELRCATGGCRSRSSRPRSSATTRSRTTSRRARSATSGSPTTASTRDVSGTSCCSTATTAACRSCAS